LSLTMIDLHTHILPDWDDGARSEAEARHMVEIAFQDGIKTIGLTPHIFRLTKHSDNFGLLESRFEAWAKAPLACPMNFVRGAEVYVRHDLALLLEASPSLRVNGGSYFFLELPGEYPVAGLKDLLFEVMLGGFTPILSHPERCLVFRERPGLLYDLVTMGALVQVTSMSLEGEFGSAVQKAALEFLKLDLVHIIASDAHDGRWRVPRLSGGVERAAQVVGWEKAEAMVTVVPEAIINDQGLPDLWAPRPPR